MSAPTTDIVLLERDLFFVAKVRETAKQGGRVCHTAKTAAEVAARVTAEPRPAIVLVHFGAPGIEWQEAIRAAHAAGVPVLAYGSHVDIADQTAARAAGATRVIPNSRLAGDPLGQIDQTIARAADQTPAPADPE